MRLTAAAILAADDLASASVDCPEWGGAVTVRELSVLDRGRMATAAEDPARFPAWLVATAAIDAETGEALFPEGSVEALAAKSPKPIKRLAEVVLRLSGLSDEEGQAEKN